MSLIQDALKRQQEESESKRVPPQDEPAPSVPDAMPLSLRAEPANLTLPEAPLATDGLPIDLEKPVQSGKSWKQIAGIIIFFILVIWGGGLLARLVLKQSSECAWLGKFMPNFAHARLILGKPSVKAPLAPAHPPAATVVTPAFTPIPWISPAAAAAPAFCDEAEEDEDAFLSGVNKQELPVIAPGPAPVAWPRLKLSAIFSNMGSGRAGARLNNRLILLGDQIEGVTIVEIHPDSVVLKCGDETRLLKMGATIGGI